jgi:transcriptional regulator with XRE-family HTH domain
MAKRKIVTPAGVVLKIKEIRLQKNKTQIYVCERTGLSQPFFSQIENGAIEIKVSDLCKIKKALDVGSLEELIDCDGGENQ